MVEGVESVDRPGPAHSHNPGAYLALVEVAVGPPYHPPPVDEGLDLGGDVGEVGG